METRPDSRDVVLGTGGYFDIFQPDRPGNGRIRLETIARGLANICRYGGQPKDYYSVAEHSVLVSRMVDPKHAREALMHDASEALIGDIRSPLKKIWPEYQQVEQQIERFLSVRFNLAYPPTPDIKAADRAICWFEQRALFGNTDDWGIPEPSETMIRNAGGAIEIQCLGPRFAHQAFMTRAAELDIR